MRHLIYRGQDAIKEVLRRFNSDDLAASSHWRNMHSTFSVSNNGTISGMRGFGGFYLRSNMIMRLAHFILGRGMVKLGAKFKSFPQVFYWAKEICKKQHRIVDQDMLRQVITLSYLIDSKIPIPLDSEETIVLVIGDGWGSFSSLLLKSTSSRVILINLNKTLLADLININEGLNEISLCFIDSIQGLKSALSDPSIRLISLSAENYKLLASANISLAINIASMQEMTYESILGYFDVMRNCPSEMLYFYCCNRERKTLPDGTLIEFAKYGWSDTDFIVDSGVCDWHQKYYTSKPPFFRQFDGVHIHRLARLK